MGSGASRDPRTTILFIKTLKIRTTFMESEDNFLFGQGSEMQKAITSSWSRITSRDLIGQKIYTRIFAGGEKLKEAHELNKLVPANLSIHPAFTNHADLIGKLLETVVEDLQEGRRFAPRLRQLGVTHAHLSVLDAALFDPDYCDVFWAAIVDVICTEINSLGDQHSGRARAAWHALLARCAAEMKNAYYQERLRTATVPTGEAVNVLSIFQEDITDASK